MGLLDKAKQLGDKVNESITTFSSDEVIASTVMKAVEKQEKINAILRERGCNYRIGGIELGMGIPPSVTFGVQRIDDKNEPTSSVSEADEEQLPTAFNNKDM